MFLLTTLSIVLHYLLSKKVNEFVQIINVFLTNDNCACVQSSETGPCLGIRLGWRVRFGLSGGGALVATRPTRGASRKPDRTYVPRTGPTGGRAQ